MCRGSRIVPRCIPLPQVATGDLKNTPNHHFLPNVDVRAPVRPGCQIRQVRSGGAEVGDLGRLIGDQGEINDSESAMLG